MTDPLPKKASTPKKRRSKGLRFLLHGYRFALIAAIVLLIRWNAIREQAAQLGPVDVPLEQVQAILPEAAALTPAADREGAYIADAEGDRIGWAVTTLPTCNRIIGFSGPTNTLVVVDTENQIRGIAYLSTRDTPEHLAEVREESWFAEQFVGKSPTDLASTKLDAVSGATLTSMAIIESVTKIIGVDPPNYRFPREVTVEEVAEILPEAATLQPREVPRGWYGVLDGSGQEIGTAWRTSPAADNHIGYQGPSDVLVVMDTEGKLKAVALRKSYDNEPYTRYVREDWSFPTYLEGQTLEELARFDLKESGIEGVSGATMTSQAATQAVGIAAADALRQIEAAKQPPQSPRRAITFTWEDGATLAVIAMALTIAFTNLRGRRWVQLGFPVVLIVYLGFIAGDILSMALFVGWAAHPVPWEKAIGLAAVCIAAFAVPLLSKKQVYCNHICPHGAAQMLILRYSKWHWTIPAKLRPFLSAIPAVLLAVVILTAFSVIELNLAAIEPFDAYVPTIAGAAALLIFLGSLIFSAFVPMGYCRYGCPTGALISHVRWNASSDQWTRRDTVATGLLVLAVVCFLV